MSWFSELTGKAGALLDKMDQAAATSLQEAGIATPSPSKSSLGSSHRDRGHGLSSTHDSNSGNTAAPYEPTAYKSLNTPSERGAAVAQVLVGSASGSAHLTSTPKPSVSQIKTPTTPTATATGGGGSRSERKQLATDDSIFEFLNAPSAGGSVEVSRQYKVTPLSQPRTFSRPNSANPPSPIAEGNRPRPLSSPSRPLMERESEEGKRRDPSISLPGKELAKEAEKTTEEADGNPGEVSGQGPLDESHTHSSEVIPTTQDKSAQIEGSVVREVAKEAGVELEEWKQKVSNLELENKFMKREVGSLNEELSSFMTRLNGASDSRAHYESEIHALREQASRSDHMIRQLRSHEEDLQATVDARDSQIEVLRTQLSAADKALDGAKEKLTLSKKEKERWVPTQINM